MSLRVPTRARRTFRDVTRFVFRREIKAPAVVGAAVIMGLTALVALLYAGAYHVNASDAHLNVASLVLSLIGGLLLADALIEVVRQRLPFLGPGALLIVGVAAACRLAHISLTMRHWLRVVLFTAIVSALMIVLQFVWDGFRADEAPTAAPASQQSPSAATADATEASPQPAEWSRWRVFTLTLALLMLFFATFLQIRVQLVPHLNCSLSHPSGQKARACLGG
jgi:hypothetical protein